MIKGPKKRKGKKIKIEYEAKNDKKYTDIINYKESWICQDHYHSLQSNAHERIRLRSV
jgi:tRNA U54 and U55 pseudouridine synthase Pus10